MLFNVQFCRQKSKKMSVWCSVLIYGIFSAEEFGMRAIIKKAYQGELDVKPSFEALSVLSEGAMAPSARVHCYANSPSAYRW